MSTWPTYIKEFNAFLKIEKGLSENSIDAYQRDVIKLKDFAEDQKISAIDITTDNLKSFIHSLHSIGLTARTQARILSGIKQFYNFLILENELQADPTELIQMPTIGKKLPEVLTVEEIDALVEAIDLSKNEGQRNRAIIETLYSCGLRVSELVNLKFSEIYFEEGFIRVVGKGNKERLVPVNENVENEINEYLVQTRNHQNIKVNHEDYVFLNRRGAKLTREMIFTIIKDLSEKIGLTKTISPHTFRHSFATHLIEGGANLRAIQEMLGHESITTTEIYTHLDQRFLRDAIISFHPRNIKN
jgi:integrase/recombinase XerD